MKLFGIACIILFLISGMFLIFQSEEKPEERIQDIPEQSIAETYRCVRCDTIMQSDHWVLRLAHRKTGKDVILLYCYDCVEEAIKWLMEQTPRRKK